ncbi:hypothetical protein LTS18_002420, partial [Coniosporium uncinatum]
FDGFPKRLPEDTVEYIIHAITTKDRNAAAARDILSAVQKSSTNIAKKYLKDYIWQRDAFALELLHEDGLWILRGCTNFGDSVADEWLVVWILKELSKQQPNVAIRLFDTDGEFLLIEAAKALPKWLNPEVAENRVWLHEGRLKVIPLQQPSKAGSKRALSTKEARDIIKANPESLKYDSKIEQEAFHRLRDYLKAISEHFHHALVTLPRNLAYILHEHSHLISPAVEAFYLRDPIALKPLQQNGQSKLYFPPKDLVTVTVRFTKVLYAQLKSQRFAAPTAWVAMLASVSSAEVAKVEMGMKVSCGFEMLVQDPQNKDKR